MWFHTEQKILLFLGTGSIIFFYKSDELPLNIIMVIQIIVTLMEYNRTERGELNIERKRINKP